MTGKVLSVLLGGRLIGAVTEERGEFHFEYAEDYRAGRRVTPLSLSMPISSRRYGDPVVRPFLWGLLPDSEQVIERWARSYQVSPRNPFALLHHVGADCAGAAQFVAPGDVERLLEGEGGIEWLDKAEIAGRLRTLRRDPAAWHLSVTGQFSLAGAQAKTALYFEADTGRWGDPWGATPTTHILKPAITGFDDHDLNEHVCLRAARALGLEAATTDVVGFDDERAIVVERYDRFPKPDGSIERVHQEDLCQALGVPPTAKYQNEGGPTPEQIIEFLDERTLTAGSGPRAAQRFLDALAFNWIVAGTDAHAKNYSVLLSGPQVRLAPLYDIASALPYDDMYLPKLKLAMRIGREYVINKIEARHWRRLAETVGFDPDRTLQRVDEMAARMAEAFASVVHSETVKSLGSPLPERLLDRVAVHAQACRQALARE